jgi:hypothetical protein
MTEQVWAKYRSRKCSLSISFGGYPVRNVQVSDLFNQVTRNSVQK